MLLIANSKRMNIEEVLQHPLGPLPWSLANSDGSLKKTNKSALARHFEKQAPSTDNVTLPSATIVDGMASWTRCKGTDNWTFAQIRASVKDGTTTFTCVWSRRCHHVYWEMSIKNAERAKRGADSGIDFSKIIAAHKVKNWRRLLDCSSSKEKLTEFFAKDWQGRRDQIGARSLYVTIGEKCIKIKSAEVEECNDLQSNHEEAYTRLLLRAPQAAASGFRSIILVVEDTDDMVLAWAFTSQIGTSLYMRCGQYEESNKTYPHQQSGFYNGKRSVQPLLGLNAMCDTVSAFSGQGKLKRLNLIRQSQILRDAFCKLGEDWNLTEEYCLLPSGVYLQTLRSSHSYSAWWTNCDFSFGGQRQSSQSAAPMPRHTSAACHEGQLSNCNMATQSCPKHWCATSKYQSWLANRRWQTWHPVDDWLPRTSSDLGLHVLPMHSIVQASRMSVPGKWPQMSWGVQTADL